MAERQARRVAAWSSSALLAAALSVVGYWLLFTTFMVYDDEGYVLISLQNFSRHGALYDQVYTQYGPFPYLLYDALHQIFGLEFTNVTGRWITLVNWMGTSIACAVLVARTTRSLLWSTFTLVGTYTYLWVMINEPIHPGGLAACLVAVGTLIGAELWSRGRHKSFAAVMAVFGSALFLTKINVGAFFIAATVAWLALNTAPQSVARRLTWLIAIGCALLPFGLMNALIAEPWVRLYALIFTCSALGTLLVAHRAARPIVNWKTWLWVIGAGLLSAATVCALTIYRGTGIEGLLKGVVLQPLKHPGIYFFAMDWRTGSGLLALFSIGFVAWTARNNRWRDVRFLEAIAWIRLIVAALCLCALLQIIPTSFAGWGMTYGVTVTWLFTFPLQENRAGAATRAWLALVLVFQFLQAYPVAGSQINWATFLWVPLLAMGVYDAGPVLKARLPPCEPWPSRAAATVIAAGTLFTAIHLGQIGWQRYNKSQSLGLRGAETLRLPDDITYDIRIVVENLRAHSDLLFSFPGAFSANLWTGLPTPTSANATHWFSLLTPAQQADIVSKMSEHPRAALLVQRDVVDYLAQNRFPTESPLHSWLMDQFKPVLKLDGYEIWLRNDRRIAPLSTGRISRAKEHPDIVAIALTLKAPSAPVSQIEICDINQPRRPLIILTDTNTKISVQRVDLSALSLGAPSAAMFPLTLPEISRTDLQISTGDFQMNWRRALLVLRDENGGVLAEARVVE